jgi:hypothetical protein
VLFVATSLTACFTLLSILFQAMLPSLFFWETPYRLHAAGFIKLILVAAGVSSFHSVRRKMEIPSPVLKASLAEFEESSDTRRTRDRQPCCTGLMRNTANCASQPVNCGIRQQGLTRANCCTQPSSVTRASRGIARNRHDNRFRKTATGQNNALDHYMVTSDLQSVALAG